MVIVILDEISQILKHQGLCTTKVLERRSGPELLLVLRVERC